jgi:hypothetical protein
MRSPSIVPTRSLTRRSALGIVTLALVMPSVSAFAEPPAILVHKDPDCGCCAGWVQHIKDAGFAVTVEETTDLQPVKKRLGVPADLAVRVRSAINYQRDEIVDDLITLLRRQSKGSRFR